MSSIKAQVRIDQRKRDQRRAEALALVEYFAKHHPDVLAKHRDDCLAAAVARGLKDKAATDDAWRHLISRLRFLKGEA